MNGQFDFRALLLRVQELLSENDRHRLHFLLGDDVPRYLRDDLSLSGTLRLLDSLVEKAFISDQDCQYLIEAFNKIQCHDAVRRLKEYQLAQKGNYQRSFSLLDILMQENEEDKIYTARITSDINDPILASDSSSLLTDIPLQTFSPSPSLPVHHAAETDNPRLSRMKTIVRMPLHTREYILLTIILILILLVVLLIIKPRGKRVQCSTTRIPVSSAWILIATDHATYKCRYIKHGDSSTLATCRASCDATELCTAINYRPHNDCVLRQCLTDRPVTEPKAKYVVWVKKTVGWLKIISDGYLHDIDCRHIGALIQQTLSQCKERCEATTSCNGLSYRRTDEACWLKECSTSLPRTFAEANGEGWIMNSKVNTTVGDCDGLRCGCFRERCWAYVDEQFTSKGDWWCFTQKAGVFEKKEAWQTCTNDSDCSWDRTCGNCRQYKGFEELRQTIC